MTSVRLMLPFAMALCLVAAAATSAASPYTPLVIMHGIADTGAGMAHIVSLVQQLLPGIYVTALEVMLICKAMAADPNLAGGVNVMGVSQGGILMRGYLERCNNPPVKNFISWVAPMMGVYGVPVVGHLEYLNVTLDAVADCCAYDKWAQDLLSFAGYWRDPFALNVYVDRGVFLADINNEGAHKNPAYKKNVLSLENFVLIPLETGWFGTFTNNSATTVLPLEQQPFYLEDYIGIRALDESGRLHRFATTCAHQDYSSACFDKYFIANVIPFLKSTSAPTF